MMIWFKFDTFAFISFLPIVIFLSGSVYGWKQLIYQLVELNELCCWEIK